jgi:FHA domain-containing protein
MPLVISARSQHGTPSSHAIVCTFDERGGTIGRADTCTLNLPDPSRHVSRVQAVIAFHQGIYTIENVGRSNPIVINGWPMRPGEVVELFHGDQLTMGQYVLAVETTTASAASQPRDEHSQTPTKLTVSRASTVTVTAASGKLTTVTMPTPLAPNVSITPASPLINTRTTRSSQG